MAKEQFETMVVKPRIIVKHETNNYQIISEDDEKLLDSCIAEITSFMQDNSAKGKSDKVKDDTYGQAQQIWTKFRSALDNTKFNFYLDREQYEYLTNLLLVKFDYDVNAVFFVLELSDVLGSMKENGKYGENNKFISYRLTATEVTYLYHILSQHKVKGLTKATYHFANVIRRIGEISKIFDYYNNITKDLSKDIVDWVATFDDEAPAQVDAPTEKKKKAEKTA